MKKLKSIIALLIIFALIVVYFPAISIAAKPDGSIASTLAEIEISGDIKSFEDVSGNLKEATFTYTNGSVKVTGENNIYTSKEQGLNGNGETVDKWFVRTTGNVTIKSTPNTGYTSNLRENGQLLNTDTKTYTGLVAGDIKGIQAEFNQEGGNPGGENPDPQNFDTTSAISVTRKEGSLKEEQIVINGQFLGIDENEPANSISYNRNGASKVTMEFLTLFNVKFRSIKVNGTPIELFDYSNRSQWLKHQMGQIIAITAEVDYAPTYNIEFDEAEAGENEIWMGNFLWTADPNQAYNMLPDGTKIDNDVYIGNSKLQLVKATYKDANNETKTIDFTKVNLSEREFGPGNYSKTYETDNVDYSIITKIENKAINFDDGALSIPEGAMVTMKIVPEYGYQVTSFGINGEDVITGDNVSEFTFEVHKGNFHLGAKVTEVNDEVKSSSKKVTAGTIELPSGTIETGTARLSVADSKVSDEKATEFVAKAGDNYELSEVLDISLAQVFFKGSSTNVWSNNIEELDDEAIITITFSEDIDPETTKIVHNIHNGDDYEIIEILEYNKDTKTAKIKVKSFSDYAIVKLKDTNTSEQEEIDNTDENTEKENEVEIDNVEENSENETTSKTPKTGDNILGIAILLITSVLGLGITIKKLRK